MSSFDALVERVGAVLRYCALLRVAVDEHIEVELRARLSAAEYHFLVQFMHDSANEFTFCEAVAQRDALHPATTDTASSVYLKSRTTHTIDGRPLFGVEKRSMLTERSTFDVNKFCLRLDAQRERQFDVAVDSLENGGANGAPPAKATIGWRTKHRRSFTFRHAPMWRIDMTRVVASNTITDGGCNDDEERGQLLYELEFEYLMPEHRKLSETAVAPALIQLRALIHSVIGGGGKTGSI